MISDKRTVCILVCIGLFEKIISQLVSWGIKVNLTIWEPVYFLSIEMSSLLIFYTVYFQGYFPSSHMSWVYEIKLRIPSQKGLFRLNIDHNGFLWLPWFVQYQWHRQL